MSKYVYGIDLGTTYSCIAYQDENGMPVVVKNMEGSETTPSVISLVEDEPVVGQVAKDNAVFDAAYTLSLVKNKIGRTDESGFPEVIYYGENAEHEISPTEASSYTLKKLAHDAGVALEDTVENVVITCPAYFSTKQKEETKRAGELAGLAVLSIIDEPTAAALAYGCKKEDMEGQTILVYDLGGGTFDITVMKIENGKFRVICSEGNHDLGGARWDQAIYDYVEEKYREQTGDEEDFSLETEQDLRIKSENAKKVLSGKESTTIPVITENGKAKIEITRNIFDDITSVLIDETLTLTKKAIAVAQGFAIHDDASGNKIEKTIDEIVNEFQANYDKAKIDKFLLVGGSTRMPQVKEKVENEFLLETQLYEPDQAVAMGAAIYSVLCAEDMDEISVVQPDESGIEKEVVHKVDPGLSIKPASFSKGDTLGGSATDLIETITNKSYGIIVTRHRDEDGPQGHEIVNNLIMRDSVLPYQEIKTYGLQSDNQSNILVQLTECTSRNEYVEIPEANIIFQEEYDIPKGLSQDTPLDIQMSLQKDGILDIEIRIAGQVMTGQHKIDMD